MPRVPTSNVIPMQAQGQGPQPPSPTMLAMAAALMHSEGKFNAPELTKARDDRSNK